MYSKISYLIKKNDTLKATLLHHLNVFCNKSFEGTRKGLKLRNSILKNGLLEMNNRYLSSKRTL